MGKDSQASSAMEIDDLKSNSSDQIAPKFSINGSFSDPFVFQIITSFPSFYLFI